MCVCVRALANGTGFCIRYFVFSVSITISMPYIHHHLIRTSERNLGTNKQSSVLSDIGKHLTIVQIHVFFSVFHGLELSDSENKI